MQNVPLIKGHEEYMTMIFGNLKLDLEVDPELLVSMKRKVDNLPMTFLEGKSKPQVNGCKVSVAFVKSVPRQTDKGKEYQFKLDELIAKIELALDAKPLNKQYIEGFTNIIDDYLEKVNTDKSLSKL